MINAARMLQRELFDIRRVIAFLTITTLICLSGPFDTFQLPITFRSAYWGSWMFATWLVSVIFFTLGHRLPIFAKLPPWLRSLMALSVSAPLATIAGSLMATIYFGIPLTPSTYLGEVGFLAPIQATLFLFLHFTRPAETIVIPHLSPGTAHTVFFKRIPGRIGTNLQHISVADHYLQVTTNTGKCLILLSLKEALSELANYPGMQIHRSHWIAFNAYHRRFWKDSQLYIELKDKTTLPVSRHYRARLLKHISETAL